MADFSTYKGLELPKSPERYNIQVFNKNNLVIDSELHKLDLKNESQDNLLATNEALNAEISRASEKENKITQDLNSEIKRAEGAENSLFGDINNEINRAAIAENNIQENLSKHISDKSNPHQVTPKQIGLNNVDNTADIDKPVSTAQQNAINSAISTHNTSSASHEDIRTLIAGLTTRLNTLADSDDTTLDQLSEIVAYIKNNKSLIEGITTSKVNVSDVVDNLTSTATNKPLSAKQGKVLKDLINDLTSVVGDKVDKVPGKELSTNDYTNAEKTKLGGIASGAEVNVQSDWNITDTNSDAYIKNKPTSMPASDVQAWAKAQSKPSYTKSEVGLGNVDNKSSATIRGELTKENVTSALGYTPPTTNTTYPYYNKTIDADFTTKFRTETKGDTNKGNYIANVRQDTANVPYAPRYGSGIAWGSNDTHGYLSTDYNGEHAFIGGGNQDKLNWVKEIAFKDSIPAAVRVKGNAETDYRTGDVNLTPANIGALAITGGTFTGEVQFLKGAFVNRLTDNNANGYVNFAHIQIKDVYCDDPIKIEICKRGQHESTIIFIGFKYAFSRDPELNIFSKQGDCTPSIYINKTSESNWDLYIKKNGYDVISIFNVNTVFSNHFDITYPNVFVDNSEDTWIEATVGGTVKESLNADTVDGKHASDFLPKIGGDLSGTLYAKDTYVGGFSSLSSGTMIPIDDPDDKSSLRVNGTTHLHGEVKVDGSIQASGQVMHVGETFMDGDLHMGSNEDANIDGVKSLRASGEVTIGGRLTLGSTLDLSGQNIEHGNSATFDGTLRSYGDLITHNIKPYADNTYNLGNSSKYYKNAYIKNLKGNADTATNADTVDGKHASDFVPYQIIFEGNPDTIITPGLYMMRRAISDNNPDGNTYYGLIVLKSDIGVQYVEQIAFIEDSNSIYIRYGSDECDDGSVNWSNWTSLLTTADKTTLEKKFLPLAGGTLNKNAWISLSGDSGLGAGIILAHSTNDNQEVITINPAQILVKSNDSTILITSKYINPGKSGIYDLGSINSKLRNIYATNGTIQTSDAREKDNIIPLSDDLTKAFIMGLVPSSYTMVNGTSGRTHWGFISQHIEELMEELGMESTDFGGFIKSPKTISVEYEEEYETEIEVEEEVEVDGKMVKQKVPKTVTQKRKKNREEVVEGEYIYSLRYDEFIPAVTKFVQMQEDKIVYLESTIQNHSEEIESLKETVKEQREKIQEQDEIIQNLSARLVAVELHLNST